MRNYQSVIFGSSINLNSLGFNTYLPWRLRRPPFEENPLDNFLLQLLAMARFQNLYELERRLVYMILFLIQFSPLTFEFAPLARDEIERICITCDDVLASVSRRATKDDNFRL